MYENIKLCSKNIILVTGMTRSGKTLICPIISSLNRCEQFFFNSLVENISVMNLKGSLNNAVADHLIKKAINENIQDKLLGRNLNYKKNDFTSLKKNKKKHIYAERTNSIKSKNFDKMKEFKINYFPILFHEALFNLKLLEKSLNCPKIINISRHPVDLICSWLSKKYGQKHYSTVTNTVCTYYYNSVPIPFFSFGIEKEILKQKTQEDRILRMISNLNYIFKKNYNKSKLKKNIILIKYDSFVMKPFENINLICKKFKLKKNKLLKYSVKDQNCPRKINYKLRDENYKKIFKKLSVPNRKIFNKMIQEYESRSDTF